MTSPDLLERVLSAHGGRQRWGLVTSIEASFSSGGFAFSSKFQGSALHGLKIAVEPHARRVVLRGFSREGWCGVWTPGRVEIRDHNDAVVAERDAPRDQFRRFSRQLRWDKLDILYFAGYALWNYLSFPFLLLQPGITVTAAPETPEPGLHQLLASFDASVPTHCRRQRFLIDACHQLVRHDYTADVIGSWAHAANCCLASEQVEGLRFYTRRKVYPLLGQRVLPFPTLVWIELDDIQVRRSTTLPIE